MRIFLLTLAIFAQSNATLLADDSTCPHVAALSNKVQVVDYNDFENVQTLGEHLADLMNEFDPRFSSSTTWQEDEDKRRAFDSIALGLGAAAMAASVIRFVDFKPNRPTAIIAGVGLALILGASVDLTRYLNRHPRDSHVQIGDRIVVVNVPPLNFSKAPIHESTLYAMLRNEVRNVAQLEDPLEKKQALASLNDICTAKQMKNVVADLLWFKTQEHKIQRLMRGIEYTARFARPDEIQNLLTRILAEPISPSVEVDLILEQVALRLRKLRIHPESEFGDIQSSIGEIRFSVATQFAPTLTFKPKEVRSRYIQPLLADLDQLSDVLAKARYPQQIADLLGSAPLVFVNSGR